MICNEHPPLEQIFVLGLFQCPETSLNSGLCSLWSMWNLKSSFSSEHITTLALSETSIWEFWDRTGQHPSDMPRAGGSCQEQDAGFARLQDSHPGVPQPGWWGEISCLSSALLLAAGRRGEQPPEELGGQSSVCGMEGPCLLSQESMGGLEGRFSGKQ